MMAPCAVFYKNQRKFRRYFRVTNNREEMPSKSESEQM